MAKQVSKYTPEMVGVITAAAMQGPLNAERAAEIAATPLFAEADITPRMVIAKIRSMGVPYEKQAKVTKTGEPVITKEALAEQIALHLGVPVKELASLAKAEKPALRALAAAVADLTAVEAQAVA